MIVHYDKSGFEGSPEVANLIRMRWREYCQWYDTLNPQCDNYKSDELLHVNYCEAALEWATWKKIRFSEAEPIILRSAQYAFLYARDVIHGRWDAFEALFTDNLELLEEGDLALAYDYVTYVIDGGWPEMESAFLKYPYYAYLYTRFLKWQQEMDQGGSLSLFEPSREWFFENIAPRDK